MYHQLKYQTLFYSINCAYKKKKKKSQQKDGSNKLITLGIKDTREKIKLNGWS
mgnify:CR=1 FL=1